MDIRDEIRFILREVFSEAMPSSHFKDRVHTRLTSDLYTEPDFDYSTIQDEINLIKRINFDDKYSFAVHLNTYPVTYVSVDPETKSKSVGNEIWAVVRNNKITTIFFRNSSQEFQVAGTDHKMTIKRLRKYYDSKEKNPDGTVDLKVGEFFHKQGKGSRKKVNLDLPMVEIGGNKWYVDEENEKLIYAKNIKKSVDFDDLKEEVLEKVINAVVA